MIEILYGLLTVAAPIALMNCASKHEARTRR